MSTPETAQPTPEQVYVRTPEVEIFENDEALWVSADMPGVAPGNVDVSLDDGTLTVDGRVADSDRAGAEPRTARHFRRRFALRDPNRFDTEHISAVLRHGVLEVRLPKAAQARRRQIPVSVN
ncbi:MAG: Hsp20/alpha crystallin family protein [Candidatus Binatia bacterium]